MKKVLPSIVSGFPTMKSLAVYHSNTSLSEISSTHRGKFSNNRQQKEEREKGMKMGRKIDTQQPGNPENRAGVGFSSDGGSVTPPRSQQNTGLCISICERDP